MNNLIFKTNLIKGAKGDKGDIGITESIPADGVINYVGEGIPDGYQEVDAPDIVGAIVDIMYPVGALYFSTTNVNPGTYMGGTWVSWGSGRVPVGVDSSDSSFDTVEETGGAKTINYTPSGSNGAVTLTAAQSGVPAHSHSINAINTGDQGSNHIHVTDNEVVYANHSGNGNYEPTASSWSATNSNMSIGRVNVGYNSASHVHAVPAHNTNNNTAANASASHNHTFTGTAATLNNLQPYITCYMWKRTA